jgi:hypothetical protein
MYEFVVVMCIASNLYGEEVNPCFGEKSKKLYMTYEICKEAGQLRELEVTAKVLENRKFSQFTPVAVSYCGEYKE